MQKKTVTALLTVLVLFTACSKDFLDLTPPNAVPLNEAIVDENSMQTAVNGMYSGLRAIDLFGRSIPIDGDLLADNIYLSPQNSNRYIPEYTYTYIETNGVVNNMWAGGYNVILRANNIINADIPSNEVVDQLKGEARTIRALCYFELVKFFAPHYGVNPNADGVPLVLQYDPNLKPARNTVAEVYNQIEADLLAAYELLTQEKGSAYVSKYVAASLLARMYQFKGDWENALNWSLDVLQNGNYGVAPGGSLLSYWANPASVSNRLETIFEIDFDVIGNNGTDDLAYFYAQEGYGDALATDDLYNLYSETDVRRELIIPGSRAGIDVWVVNKYPNTTNPNDKDNIKVIRFAEVVYILIEALYRLGDEANAVSLLNQLTQLRDFDFPGYTSTGAQLLEDIYTERRKELAFEGHRYWDLVRLGRAVVRDNSTGNYQAFVPLELPVSSPRRIYPIPKAELNVNSNVEQNEGY
jgi:hypothetical protein